MPRAVPIINAEHGALGPFANRASNRFVPSDEIPVYFLEGDARFAVAQQGKRSCGHRRFRSFPPCYATERR